MKIALLLCLAMPAALVQAQAIDCAKARTPTELTICRTPTLLQADARMSALQEVAAGFSGMGTAAAMRDDQHAFLARRERCGTNVSCLADLYRKQTEPYVKQIEHVRTFGPF